jgi:short-subunit dehydrogenase
MSDKYLIFGATGSIGSSLAQQLKDSNQEAHLISRNEDELKALSEKLGFSFTVADVLEDGFIDQLNLMSLMILLRDLHTVLVQLTLNH